MAELTKRQRLEAAARGEAVDRVPVALWRHWPGDDERAGDQARAHLDYQRLYDWDLLKVTPSSSYSVEDWGVEHRYLGSLEGTGEYVRRRVVGPRDWEELEPLDPRAGVLGRQLECLRGISAGLEGQVPFIQTIFNPLSVARYLAGDERLLVHLRRHPEAVSVGLRIITQTLVGFVREVLSTGAAGLFFAVQHAQYGLLNEKEYRTYGEPYDLEVLRAAVDAGAWFNLLHLHGEQVMFDALAHYPVQAINWHDRETPPTLAEALDRFSGLLCGGLRQWDTMVRGTPDDVRREAADAIRQTSGRRFMLGTGCVTPIVAPTSNLRAAREAVNG